MQESKHLARSVSIVGVGYTPFGPLLETPEMKGLTENELVAMAFIEALNDCGLEAKNVDAFYVGQYMPETLSHSNSVAAHYSDWLGLSMKTGIQLDGACCSSGLALRNATQMVASGVCDVVASFGVETTTCVPVPGKPLHMRQPFPPNELAEKTNYGDDQGYFYWAGETPNCDSAALEYARKYGLTMAQMDDILNMSAYNNRRAGVLNPKATIATKSFEEEAKDYGFNNFMDYLRSDFNMKIGIVTRIKHMPSTVDGASCVIVMPTDLAKKMNLCKRAVEVAGLGSCVSTRAHYDGMYMAAAKQAYSMAGITNPRKEVGYFSPHDCMIVRQMTHSEAYGYFDEGEAWKYILEGRTAYDGDRPFHTSGGRHSMGHAWAASAGAEVCEAVMQMREEGGKRQVKVTPKIAVISSEGAGPNTNAIILRK